MSNPLRDTQETEFSRIMATMENSCTGFEAIVFFDSEGETIDYHSYLDPYDTRLTSAYLGVIVSSAIYRFNFLGLGNIKYLEFLTSKKESLTVNIGDDLFVSIILKAGSITDQTYRTVDAIVKKLQQEIGL